MKMIAAIDTLSALAHDGRLSVYHLLVRAGPKGVAAGGIARKLGMPPSSLSANLAILAQARLVTSKRDGRSIIYAANYDAMAELLAYLMEDCCGGRPEICGLVMTSAAAACRPLASASAGAKHL
ncbi:MAG: metalloregulator ArsR/SmtB family transcription factor [Alphaproteobacteria bacterium]